MFCTNCGSQVPDDSKFCPSCGTPCQESSSSGETIGQETQNQETWNQSSGQSTWDNSGAGGSNDGEKKKFDIKDYLTDENIERFAPLAAFLPLVMGVTVGIVGRVIGIIPLVGPLIRVLMAVLFVLAALAATVGLFYLALQRRDSSKITTWIAPVVVLLAFIACFCNLFHWTAVAVVLGIITVIMGLEFLARITIAGNTMDSPVNIGEDINVYKEFYTTYKQNNPPSTSPQVINGDKGDSYFDGTGLQLLGMEILTVLVCAITCGIAAPWMICKIYKWRIEHTVINGKRFTFNGTGAELLGKWILWEILTIITCGIYGFFTWVALRKWETSHTFIDGEPVVAGQTASYFDGNSFEFFGYGILGGLLVGFTCGIGTPWMVCMIQKWDTKHQVVSGRRLDFNGSGLGFLGEFIIIALLSVITCGLYSAWGTVRMNKYIVRHTNFV